MTCATIETAWADNIWDDDDILLYTESIYKYEQTRGSEFEVSKLYYDEHVNFITYAVNVFQAFGVTGEVRNNYTVLISYTREQDTTGDNYTSIRDFFEDLLGKVTANLGDRWDSTVDLWNPPSTPPDITETTVENTPCWQATGIYTAQVSTSA
jgi:hypothetical protein